MPTDPEQVPPGAATRRRADGRDDQLVREEPLLLVVHDQQLLTMRTPGQDEDLAVGFLLGEGIVPRADDVAALRFVAGDPEAQRADELQIDLRTAPAELARARLARTHEIRSSCGVCGVADPQTVLDGTPPLLPGVPRLPTARIDTLLTELRRRQQLFAATGGCHGALIATAAGEVRGFGEDVGRHNALDKAIGMAARAGADLPACVAVLSGRAGFDLVVKCLRVRIAVIVSVSAPSALAFDLCATAGATLLGFARDGRFETYCGGERLSV
ncbi:MAG: formate dehydrogenase accessory sulfurtransferase FdhD [Planctomycetes bacterium]|nr:formate dehydrogenase accessory sulfurtransferase FdhD [Planctomycetota bacterium]